MVAMVVVGLLVYMLFDGGLWAICAWMISCGLRLFVPAAFAVLLRFAVLGVLGL